MKETLRDLLAQRALRVAGPGEWFTLSTGRKSKFYFNCKPITLSSDGASLVADAFLEKVRSLPEQATAVGGFRGGQCRPCFDKTACVRPRRPQA